MWVCVPPGLRAYRVYWNWVSKIPQTACISRLMLVRWPSGAVTVKNAAYHKPEAEAWE